MTLRLDTVIMNYQSFVAVALFFGLLGWCLIGLSRNAKKLHAELDEWERKAKAAPRSELSWLRSDFVRWASRNCCYSAFSERARRIISYIDGRLS